MKAVVALGYEEATPIQRAAIPVLLAGRDIIGQAGTGTGKTAAFVLPMLHRLLETPATKKGAPRALILVPTRELAMQVAEAVHKYAKQTRLTVVPLYGGAPMDQQIRALHRGVEIVVATPGRALDHLRRETLDLSALEVLVLDEADEMLDMGFAEDLEAILTATPDTRQTALFAATMAPRIASIAERHLRKPERITIKAEKRAAGKMPQVRQAAYVVSRQQKGFALGRILEFEDPTSAIVFCRTRIEVDELTDTLKSHGYGAQALHGGLDQRQRDRVMQLFRTGKADVLVATDVAARGLDIDHVSHVINYDIPTAPEVYVHRIGRTGRIGREGVAITLVDPREQRTLRYIEISDQAEDRHRHVADAGGAQGQAPRRHTRHAHTSHHRGRPGRHARAGADTGRRFRRGRHRRGGPGDVSGGKRDVCGRRARAGAVARQAPGAKAPFEFGRSRSRRPRVGRRHGRVGVQRGP